MIDEFALYSLGSAANLRPRLLSRAAVGEMLVSEKLTKLAWIQTEGLKRASWSFGNQ
jgi:hypothetical protein